VRAVEGVAHGVQPEDVVDLLVFGEGAPEPLVPCARGTVGPGDEDGRRVPLRLWRCGNRDQLDWTVECGVHTRALFDSEAKGLEGAARERHYAALFACADDAVGKLLAG
jgi:hypothetical protein